MKIAHKIANVSDEAFTGCPQLWEGECRAFQMTHSEAERVHRAFRPACNCNVPKELKGRRTAIA